MKIVIVGPGAMGCLIGGFLSRAKQDIMLLDKDAKRAGEISKRGIRVEGISDGWSTKVRATARPDEITDAGLIIICTKSYDTEQAVREAADIIGEHSLVLTLQNGAGNVEIISDAAGKERVIGGSTSLGSTLLGPGHVRHAGTGETVIGRPDGKISPSLIRIKDVFDGAGLPVRISDDIKSLIWSKLIINTGINALAAITHLNNGRLPEFEGTREIMKGAVAEAVKITHRKKIKLIFNDPLSKVKSVCEATAGNKASMLQDVLKEKRTEIDFINGVIVREGKALGIETPVNETLTNLVRTIEQSYGVRFEN